MYCKRHGEDKELLAKGYAALHEKSFFQVFKDSFWALLTPVLILGGIYGGILTPTEAAAASVLYSLIISLFVYKSITIKDFPGLLKEAIDGGVAISLVVAAATVFSRCLTLLQIPHEIGVIFGQIFTTKVAFLLGMNVLLLFIGMILDTTSAILILTPLLLPIAESFGISPYHFGIIMVVNLAVGFVTPPVGANLYVASGISGMDIVFIAKKALPFIITFLFALLLITFIPQISLCLLG